MRPPHLCRCGRIVQHGSICQCVRKDIRFRNARHDAKRLNARQRGYNSDWDKARKEWLRFNPCCAMCGAEANTVDHVIAHKGNKVLFWNKANWQSLCTPCHNRHKQKQERQR